MTQPVEIDSPSMPSMATRSQSSYIATLYESELQGVNPLASAVADHHMAPVVFSSPSSGYLADLIALRLGFERGQITRREFRDGEQYYRIHLDHRTALTGRDVILVAATASDVDLLFVYRIGCQLADLGTRRRIFIIPFLGYSTMERAVRPGEVVTCKVNCRMLSSIPSTSLGNIFMLMDLHVSGILQYFEGPCMKFEIYAEHVLCEAVQSLNLPPGSFMFATPDLGRPQWVQTFANHFGTELALIRKSRSHEETHVHEVIGDVEGKHVIIFDDMLRSGGTLRKAATAYKKRGALSVYALISHLAIPDEDTIIALTDSDINLILGTNSHPSSMLWYVQDCPKIRVFDCSGCFTPYIRKCCVIANPKTVYGTPSVCPD